MCASLWFVGLLAARICADLRMLLCEAKRVNLFAGRQPGKARSRARAARLTRRNARRGQGYPARHARVLARFLAFCGSRQAGAAAPAYVLAPSPCFARLAVKEGPRKKHPTRR